MNGARYAYLQKICQLVEDGHDIVVVSEDYAAPVFDDFRLKYPQRFLSVGIAEQNGMAVACGLALAGKYPIVYGCAPFPLTRAMDQIKSAVAGMHLPMTILNSGIGFGVPEFGATHYNIDDISLLRAVPGLKIVTPTDNIMAQQFANYSIQFRSPIYLRMDKNCEGILYRDKKFDFEQGFSVVWQPQKRVDAVIVSTGYMLHEMLNSVREFENENLYFKLIDIYGIPFDYSAFIREIGELSVISVEEHTLQGGIGSIILEMLNMYYKSNRVYRFGVSFQENYPMVSGSREFFVKKFGLDKATIENSIRHACEQIKNE